MYIMLLLHSSLPLSTLDMFQDSHRMPETVDSTKTYVNCFSLHMHAYEKFNL